tara:strand:+ start:6541 stop:6906 length:366 start_codon:yes stop_codon:yes gene_type:complete
MAHQKKRQLDYNPVTGETEWYHYDSIEDKFTLEKMQDIEPILIANKEQYNSFDERARFGNPLKPSQETWTHYARVPNVILEQMPREMRQGIMSGKSLQGKKWKQWINDLDNRMFRTRPGKI